MPKYFSSFRFDLLLFLVLLLTSKLHCSLESLDKELCQVHQRKEWGSETKKRERVKVSPSFSLLQSTKKQVIDLILLLSSWETREVSFIVVVVSILRLLQLLFSLKYSLLQPISRLEKRNAGTTWIEAEGMSLSLLKMRQPSEGRVHESKDGDCKRMMIMYLLLYLLHQVLFSPPSNHLMCVKQVYKTLLSCNVSRVLREQREICNQ